MTGRIGFSADEIRTHLPTRRARLRRVVVVDASLPTGRAANVAVCVAAATTVAVDGLLGPDAVDADGWVHPGLPWAGCSILAASTEHRAPSSSPPSARAVGEPDLLVADLPATRSRPGSTTATPSRSPSTARPTSSSGPSASSVRGTGSTRSWGGSRCCPDPGTAAGRAHQRSATSGAISRV